MSPTGRTAPRPPRSGGLPRPRLGDAAGADQAIAAARDARERDHRDELLEIGGEFGFSRAAQSYYTGFVLSEAARGQPPRGAAVTELESATGLYGAGPGPGEH